MTRFQKALPWLIGILIATLLMGSLAVFSGFQYAGNDDTPILRSSMGYEGGEPATFILNQHAACTWFLYGLAKLFPGVGWFSILQLWLLWFSQVVIVKSLCRLAQRKGLPLWAGAAAGALFLGAFTLYISCRITYTMTASLCGAAAVFQLAGTDFTAERKQIYLGSLGGAAMLLCCYFLRLPAVLPSACFFLLLFAAKLLAKRSRHALFALLITALLFGAFAGLQFLNIQLHQIEDDLQWQDLRIELFDYVGFWEEVPDETLTQIGWSRDELTLVRSWFFLNDNITAEAFQTLIDQQTLAKNAPTLGSRMRSVLQAVTGIFDDAKPRFALWCMLLMAFAAALHGGKRTRFYLAAVLAGGFALLLILADQGRLPLRAVYSVLLPMGAAVFASFFDAAAMPKRRWGSAMMYASLAACLVLAVFAGIAQADDTYIAPNPYFTDTESHPNADLDEIALIHEDKLILYDLSLSNDYRLFSDTSGGIPQNLMLWGGWPAHSPSWRQMLANFGITELNSSLFLRDNVLYASTYDQPPAELMNYISEGTDKTVDWYYYDQWGYVNLFEFEAY